MTTSLHWGSQTKFFYELTPDKIFTLLEEKGFIPSGKFMALNSLENRVYDVELRNSITYNDQHIQNLVVKFYRPGRWDKQTLIEEHQFYHELEQYEVPVISPLLINDESLFFDQDIGIYWCVFPKYYGRLKDELTKDESQQMGRLLGRVHNIGQLNSFKNRPIYLGDKYLSEAKEFLLTHHFIPANLIDTYISLSSQLEKIFDQYKGVLEKEFIRLHGDFHRGNILFTKDGPYLTDLDDSMMGPRTQDLWLLYPGRDDDSIIGQNHFIGAYNEMTKLQLSLSPLEKEKHRVIRMINFNHWIAKRYEDPIFIKTFSSFNENIYWEQHLQDLKEALALFYHQPWHQS